MFINFAHETGEAHVEAARNGGSDFWVIVGVIVLTIALVVIARLLGSRRKK